MKINKTTKSKKIIFIVLPLLFTIYQVYLINRIWEISKKTNLMIGITIVGILYLLFYLFYKRIDYKKIDKKGFLKIIIASALLTLFILGTNFSFFTKKYTESTIEIFYGAENEQLNLPIRNIIVDNIPKTVESIQKESPTTFSFEKAKDIIIVFEKNQNNGFVKIKDGKEEKDINLYSYKDEIYAYQVESNKSMSFFSGIRFILSFIMIEILTFMFCIATYYLYREKKSLLLPILFLIVIIRLLFYQEVIPYIVYNDSIEYEKYSFSKLLNGELQDRVPVYPIIIKIFMFFCDDLWRNFICIAQMIASFISLIYLYKTLKLFIKWDFLVSIIVFLYGTCIAVIGWDTAILTESIALSSTILFIYLISSYLKTNKLKYGILSIILIFLMIFLRPSFIGFLAILLSFFIIKMIIEKENRKKDIICLFVSIITGIIIWGYAFAFYKQHDIFSITKASVRQDLYVCMHEGFYKNSKDEQFIKDVENSMNTQDSKWNAMMKILNDYGDKKVQELVKVSKRESMQHYIKYLFNLVNTNSNEYFDSYYNLYISDVSNAKLSFIKSFMFLKFSTVYLIIIIEGTISLYKWIKNKRPDWIHLGLFGFITAVLVTSFIGTNGEFMRTAICVVPFSYMAIGLEISDLVEKYKKQE